MSTIQKVTPCSDGGAVLLLDDEAPEFRVSREFVEQYAPQKGDSYPPEGWV